MMTATLPVPLTLRTNIRRAHPDASSANVFEQQRRQFLHASSLADMAGEDVLMVATIRLPPAPRIGAATAMDANDEFLVISSVSLAADELQFACHGLSARHSMRSEGAERRLSEHLPYTLEGHRSEKTFPVANA